MAFVAVIDVFLYSESLQHEHTADSKKNFLLQPILPVASVESVGDWTVELRVEVVVGIEQIERNTSYIYAPYAGIDVIVHIRHINDERFAVLVVDMDDRKRIEILCLVVGNLLSVHAKALTEISVLIEESYSAHVDIAVGGFFHIVAGKHAKTTRIDFKYMAETIFHTEVCHRRTCRVWLFVHVFRELVAYFFHILHYVLVFHNLFFSVVAETLEQSNGIVVDFFIEILVETFPKFTSFVVPRPPHVVGKFVKTFQLLGEG